MITAYDGRAAEYARVLGRISATAPADRDTIAAWALACDGPVLDLGCGPGHWTAYLDGLGVEVSGVDPSAALIELARRTHRGVTFRRGTADDERAESAVGVLAWYSLIHTEPKEVGDELVALRRLLRPGGRVLVGFFAGDEVAPFGHAVATAWTWSPEWISRRLEAAGLVVEQVRRRQDPSVREHGEAWAHAPRSGSIVRDRVRDVAGGPGWVLSGDDLDPVITDAASFRAGLAQDPLAGAIESLWTGRVEEARAMLRAADSSVRSRALLADCDRRSGDPVAAARSLRILVAEHEDDAWSPVLRQHLGKALLAAGNVDGARRQLRLALEARTRVGADPHVIASSRQALARTAVGGSPRGPLSQQS